MEAIIKEKCVLITGATAGIGYELAKLYAKNNRSIILIARDKQRLQNVQKELKSEKNNVYILSLDLKEIENCNKIVDFLDENCIEIDTLINNAGIGTFGELLRNDDDKELELIDINIKSLVKITKIFLPMIIKNKGSIMNVASTAAFCAGPKMANYYASKAYVLNLTEALHEEVKGEGVKVSCLCPGAVATEFQSKAGIKKRKSANKNLMLAEDVAKIAYKDFQKGKVIIIPGFKNKLAVIINKFIPRSVSRKLIFTMNKGES